MSGGGEGTGNEIYPAFVSYSRADRAIAQTLQQRLEGFVLPRALRLVRPGLRHDARPLKPIFRDEDELVPGQSLPDRIRAALAASSYLIVVCSPSAAKSEWVEREITDFAALGKAENILAVVVGGEPHAAERGLDPALECLPPGLRFQLVGGEGAGPIEVTGIPAEPLWIDWRVDARKDRRMFLRIVAALTALARFDDLIQRDARRARNRQLIAAGSIALLATGAGVATTLIGRAQSNLVAHELTVANSLAASALSSNDDVTAARYAVASLKNGNGEGFRGERAAALATLHAALSSGMMADDSAGDAHVVAYGFDKASAAIVGVSLRDGAFERWNPSGGEPSWRATSKAIFQSPTGVDFTAATDGGVAVALTANGTSRAAWELLIYAPNPPPHPPDETGRFVFERAYDSTFVVGDSSREVSLDDNLDVRVLSLAASGDRVAILLGSGDISVYDTDSGNVAGHWSYPQASVMALSDDGRLLAAGLSDGKLIIRGVKAPGPQTFSSPFLNAAISAVAFSHDGSRVAVGTENGSTLLFAWRTSGPNANSDIHSGNRKITSFVFSPDDKTIAIGTDQGSIQIVRVGESEGASLSGIARPVQGLKFSPDQHRLIAALDGSNEIWSVPSVGGATASADPESAPQGLRPYEPEAASPGGGEMGDARTSIAKACAGLLRSTSPRLTTSELKALGWAGNEARNRLC